MIDSDLNKFKQFLQDQGELYTLTGICPNVSKEIHNVKDLVEQTIKSILKNENSLMSNPLGLFVISVHGFQIALENYGDDGVAWVSHFEKAYNSFMHLKNKDLMIGKDGLVLLKSVYCQEVVQCIQKIALVFDTTRLGDNVVIQDRGEIFQLPIYAPSNLVDFIFWRKFGDMFLNDDRLMLLERATPKELIAICDVFTKYRDKLVVEGNSVSRVTTIINAINSKQVRNFKVEITFKYESDKKSLVVNDYDIPLSKNERKFWDLLTKSDSGKISRNDLCLKLYNDAYSSVYYDRLKNLFRSMSKKVSETSGVDLGLIIDRESGLEVIKLKPLFCA